MDAKQIKVNQGNSWEYIPGPDTLLEYLDRVDLVELSKCCKSYRDQLKSRVFENSSLETWRAYNWKIFQELKENNKLEESLEFLKTDLGSKLKLVKKFTLNCMVDCGFAEKFVKLLPNIKTLFFYGCNCCICNCCNLDCFLSEGCETILKGMEGLEHVYFSSINDEIDEYNSTNSIFPKSIKSLKIGFINTNNIMNDDLLIYSTIDASYKNLYSLTIITSKMLENLSSGMPNLQEVEINYIFNLDTSKLVAFLKANPHLRKLNTKLINYNEELLKIIFSSKYLEHWSIDSRSWEHIKFNNLPSNCSIKYLRISNSMPDPLILHLINACKSLKTLELEINRDFNYIDWSKLERRVNKLKLVYNRQTPKGIKEIDALGLFNSVHVEIGAYTQDDINKYIDFKLNNYKLISSTSKSCTLKLINKSD